METSKYLKKVKLHVRAGERLFALIQPALMLRLILQYFKWRIFENLVSSFKLGE